MSEAFKTWLIVLLMVSGVAWVFFAGRQVEKDPEAKEFFFVVLYAAIAIAYLVTALNL